VITMSDGTIYYKFKPEQQPSGVDFEAVGEEYKGYLLSRDSTYLLWNCQTLDGSPPPIVLRGRWTDKLTAKETIDGYLRDERMKQEASETKKP
jgi:hypothetical protein